MADSLTDVEIATWNIQHYTWPHSSDPFLNSEWGKYDDTQLYIEKNSPFLYIPMDPAYIVELSFKDTQNANAILDVHTPPVTADLNIIRENNNNYLKEQGNTLTAVERLTPNVEYDNPFLPHDEQHTEKTPISRKRRAASLAADEGIRAAMQGRGAHNRTPLAPLGTILEPNPKRKRCGSQPASPDCEQARENQAADSAQAAQATQAASNWTYPLDVIPAHQHGYNFNQSYAQFGLLGQPPLHDPVDLKPQPLAIPQRQNGP